MHIPEHFKNDDIAEVAEFLKKRGFGSFCAIRGGRLISSNFPFVVKLGGANHIIEFHIPKKNPLAALAVAGKEFMVICNGPDHYIATDWYDKKQIPTWNYIAAHLYGNPVGMDEVELLAHLTELAQLNERKYAGAGWELDDNRSLVAPLFKHINGFRMELTEIQGQWKLSQNQSDAERRRLIDELREHGAAACEIADLMAAKL